HRGTGCRMENKSKVATVVGTVCAVAVGVVGFLADGFSVLDRITGSADQKASPAAPSPELTAPPSEDPAMVAQPSASTAPAAQLQFGEPEEVLWSVSDTACFQTHKINWDALGSSPAADPGEADFSYGTSEDRKSTRLNSSHVKISYAVFCLKKKRNS